MHVIILLKCPVKIVLQIILIHVVMPRLLHQLYRLTIIWIVAAERISVGRAGGGVVRAK